MICISLVRIFAFSLRVKICHSVRKAIVFELTFLTLSQILTLTVNKRSKNGQKLSINELAFNYRINNVFSFVLDKNIAKFDKSKLNLRPFLNLGRFIKRLFLKNLQ